MEGRWTIRRMSEVYANGNAMAVVASGPAPTADPTPVVPCDDAAVERAAEALYELSRAQPWPGVLGGIATSHVGFQTVAEAVLRAAGESGPDPSKSGSPEQAERGAAGPPNPKPEGGES